MDELMNEVLGKALIEGVRERNEKFLQTISAIYEDSPAELKPVGARIVAEATACVQKQYAAKNAIEWTIAEGELRHKMTDILKTIEGMQATMKESWGR